MKDMYWRRAVAGDGVSDQIVVNVRVGTNK